MLDRSGSLDRVDEYVRTGKLHEAREELLRLPEADLAILRAQLGDEDLALLFRSARRARGAKSRGKVVLIHGITGSELASVDKKGDEDGIWLNVARMILGRLARLALGLDGKAASKDWSVKSTGHLKRYYLPMLLHLNQEWEARAYSYDWRLDIDHAADGLAPFIEEFGKGEPVHVVAHSMGGLVTRRFSQRHSKLWASMRDPNGLARGGRLVMLGTPNMGSFAIPLTFTGVEKTVQMLAKLDFKHDFDEVLAILDAWPGSYQMLPSHKVSLHDQHVDLYTKDKWGKLPVHAPLLQRAQRFHEELETAVDPARMVYVAGYDTKTPDGIWIEAPGKFQYRYTFDGDGRVPHSLGLLPGVPTYYVEAEHGDLARSAQVLDAIGSLLAGGTTDLLPSTKPPSRRAPVRGERQSAAKEEEPPAEFFELHARLAEAQGARRGAKKKSGAPKPKLTAAEEARLESLVLASYLGSPKDAVRAAPEPKRKHKLPISIVWGDIRKVDADVYAVGHYVGVEPANAERALDGVVTGDSARGKQRGNTGREARDGGRVGVLTDWTRRGRLLGRHGDIDFFPWANEPRRLVAVVGMGHPGTFGRTRLRNAVRDLYGRVASLPKHRRLCMVLIGSGPGSGSGALDYRSALENLLVGVRDAARGDDGSGLTELSIVELERHKAHAIHEHLTKILEEHAGEYDVALRAEVVRGEGARIASGDGLASLLAAAAVAHAGTDAHGTAIRKLIQAFPDSTGDVREAARRALNEIVEHTQAKDAGARPRKKTSKKAATGARHDTIVRGIEVRIGAELERVRTMPTRIWFHRESAKAYCCGAITESAVVPQRELELDPKLVAELVERVTAAGLQEELDVDAERELSSLTHRLLIHRDLREILRDFPSLVIEVDRATAPVHWELLPDDVQDQRGGPIAVRVPLARQLRTTYSPPPSAPRAPSAKLRALVVGDPGDPAQRMDLPGARREAQRVAEILESCGVEVELMLGAPSARRTRDARTAGRLEVLHELMKGGWDILHYAGHCDFDPVDPSRVGWVFSTGTLTSGELATVDVAPPLVVANACLSGLTSDRLASGQSASTELREADLVPGLADEFFHRGVRNYVGTAWEVNDVGAVAFAEVLYKSLLGEGGAASKSLGEALCDARKALYDQRDTFGLLWAAYQHYGDPNYRVRE
ncbi:MAG: CHAT domain-containing protein [Planctomycetota bacterium]